MRFEIDEKLWQIDDPRVDDLHSGKISLLQFARTVKMTDPWVIGVRDDKGDRIFFVNVPPREELIEVDLRRFEDSKRLLSTTGGLNGRTIYDNRTLFRQVYPELSESIFQLEEQVSIKKCKSCELNKMARPLLDELLVLPADPARNYGPLESVLPALAMRRLKAGQPLPPDSLDLPAPYPRPEPAMRKEPRAGIPRVAWASPQETQDERTAAQAVVAIGAPRKGCFDCARKHLAQAVVLLGESLQGYPSHRWLAIGHMAEASEEILEKSRDMADMIRGERLSMMSSASYVPSLLVLIEKITELDEAEKIQ